MGQIASILFTDQSSTNNGTLEASVLSFFSAARISN